MFGEDIETYIVTICSVNEGSTGSTLLTVCKLLLVYIFLLAFIFKK